MKASDKVSISVIIPVYNQEKYVGKCIRSVLGQSFQDFEVIIVNTDRQTRAQHHSSEFPVDMQKDGLLQSVLMGDVNAFLAAVYERERFLRMHHYWKMRILKNYQRIVDVFR